MLIDFLKGIMWQWSEFVISVMTPLNVASDIKEHFVVQLGNSALVIPTDSFLQIKKKKNV